MNEKLEVPTMQVPPLKKICMTIGQLPTSYLETMSYYEMLVWFVNYLRDDIIPVVNANGAATEELQELFVTLQNYVNNYFDNLDVQDEINNKLDEMAESGQLTDIIAQYLGLAGMITFDTVAEMKLAENLVNGSKCKTLGYHTVNDNGSALYKVRTVTNEDVIDEGSIIALYDNTLVAELVVENNIVSSKQYGCVGDGTTDDTQQVQALLNYAKAHSPITILINGFHYINDHIDLIGTSDNRIININITGVDTTKAYMNVESAKCGFIFDNNFDFTNTTTGLILNYTRGINISNLKFMTNETVNDGEIPLNANYGIKVLNSTYTTIKNCNIITFYTGIYSVNSSLANIRENNVSLCNLGIQLYENGDSMLTDNYINTIGSNVYDLSGVLNSRYSSLRTNGKFYGMGIYVGGSGNMTIKGGKIEWCAIGIWQDYSLNMIYDSIQFDRCNNCAIAITGHNSTINRTTITNSNFTGCGGTSVASANQDTHIGGLTASCIGSNYSYGLLISNNKFYGDNGDLKGSFKSGQYYYGPKFVLTFDRVYYSSFINNIVEIDNNYAFNFSNVEVEFDSNIINKNMYMGENVLIYRQAGIKREFFHNNPSTATVGNFDVGDLVYNHNDLTTKWKVTTAGTSKSISTSVSVVTTATNYYPADNTVIDLGTSLAEGVRTGAYVSIAGVTGTKKIVGVIKNGTHYYAKLDSACDAAVSNATMTNVSPAFTSI